MHAFHARDLKSQVCVFVYSTFVFAAFCRFFALSYALYNFMFTVHDKFEMIYWWTSPLRVEPTITFNNLISEEVRLEGGSMFLDLNH